MLHFIAATVETKYPKVLDFIKDLEDVEPASKGFSSFFF